mgnify:CR=1 FL=1
MKYKKRITKNQLITGTKVIVKNGKIELALKKFKNKVKDAEIMLELRDRQFYKKKSDKQREKRNLIKLRHKYRKQKEQNSIS